MQPDRRNRKRVARAMAMLLPLLAACGSGGGHAPFGTAAATSVASDASGMKLVAVAAGGGIWTSTDGGITWVDRTPSGPAHVQQWMSVASDATGTNLAVVVNGFYDRPNADPAAFSGDVWTSNDSGATWIDQTSSSPAHGEAWRSVASDASGTNVVAVTAGGSVVLGPGAIWTSTDAGVTWTNATATVTGMGTQDWSSVASDATGKNLVAAGSGSGIWASTDGGATWTNRTPADPKFEASYGDQVEGWSSVASDATGTKLVAAVNTGDIWTSTDGGGTWTDAAPTTSWQVWISVASDATGTNLVAVDGLVEGADGDVWTSANGGLTWTDQTTGNPAASGQWRAVASNAAGDHAIAVGIGAIWTN